jgi:hypothetical protein
MIDARGLASYRLRRSLAPAAILAYVVLALAGAPAGRAELFPFFNWSLFSAAVNPKIDVVLVVHAIDGVELDRPRTFYELPERFPAARARDTRLAKSLDRLAEAVEAGDRAAEKSIRSLIERTFMADASQVRYEVARIGYDPIERYETGRLVRSQTLARYEKNRDD